MILRKYILYFVSLLIVLVVSVACAFYQEQDSDVHRLFNQEMMGLTRYQPFLFTIDDTYYSYDHVDSIYNDRLANVKDWQTYLGSKAILADIDSFVYATPLSVLKQIDLSKSSTWGACARNTMLQALASQKDQQALSYIIYARNCEPYFLNNEFDFQLSAADSVAMLQLMPDGIGALKKLGQDGTNLVKTPFLRERYVYQLIRLATHAKSYGQAIELYNTYIAPFKRNSLISNWAECECGRACYKLKRHAEAQYHYAQVFYNCDSRKMVAKQSFSWAYESEYNPDGGFDTSTIATMPDSLLKLCQSDTEKIAVYGLRINQWPVYQSPALLHAMYQLSPADEMVEWLMVRAVSQLQRDLLPVTAENFVDYYNYGNIYSDSRRQDMDKSYKEAIAFKSVLQQMAKAHNTRNPALCTFCAGYVSYLVNDYAASNQYFAEIINAKSADKYLVDRVHSIQILNKINTVPVLTPAFENSLLKDIQFIKGIKDNKDIYSMFWYTLARKYESQSEFTKALTCQKFCMQGYDVWNFAYKGGVDSMIAFKAKQGKTPFEELQAAAFNYYDLFHVKGTILLTQHNFEGAVDAYNHMGALPADLPADPFAIHIKDCHDCDYEQTKVPVYNRLSFARKMLALQQSAETKSPTQAQDCFNYANGLYNMTDYGNSWQATYRRMDSWTNWDSQDSILATDFFFDCGPAMKYYLKAMQMTKEKEFAAKCCFMAAKCEQNQCYVSGNYNFANVLNGNNNCRSNFAVLKGKYAKTAYYRQIIKECSYFDYYVKHGN